MSPLPVFTLLNIPAETESLVPGVTPWGLASVETDLVEKDPSQGTDCAGHDADLTGTGH